MFLNVIYFIQFTQCQISIFNRMVQGKTDKPKGLFTGRADLPSKLCFQSDFNERKWFHKHDRSKYLGLSDQMMKRLRLYFNALDSKKCQFIDGQNLEDPLIAFGLCENKEEVQKLVKQIDTDSSGVIEFSQFVQIFKTAKRNEASKKGKKKFTQFAKIITGNVGKQLQNALDIQTSISQYKRQMLLNLAMQKDHLSMQDGKRIARQVAIKSQRPDLLPIIKNIKKIK